MIKNSMINCWKTIIQTISIILLQENGLVLVDTETDESSQISTESSGSTINMFEYFFRLFVGSYCKWKVGLAHIPVELTDFGLEFWLEKIR